MVRIRCYEQDTPFGQWLRSQGSNGELPSNSKDVGVTASDVDMIVRCYKNRATGKLVQCMFFVEVKTRMANVGFAQSQVFAIVSAFAGVKTFAECDYRFYGVCRLRMSGTSPMNSASMWWDRWPWSKHGWKTLPKESDIISTQIDATTLTSILRCELHPTNLKPWRVDKTHHGHTIVTEVEKRELFDVEIEVKRRY